MRIAICEDSSHDMAELKKIIEEYPACCGIDGTYESANRLLDDYATGVRYDLLFLDIKMEGLDGYSAAEKMRKLYKDEMPLLVFTTITDKYVYVGYDVGAYGYFPKPVDKNRLFKKLDQAYEELEGRTIALNTGGETVIIPTTAIKYIESDNNMLKIVTATNEYSARMTIEDMKAVLPQTHFVRTHRSFIVNIAHVRSFDDSTAFFDGSHKAYISRQKRKAFMSALSDYLRR